MLRKLLIFLCVLLLFTSCSKKNTDDPLEFSSDESEITNLDEIPTDIEKEDETEKAEEEKEVPVEVVGLPTEDLTGKAVNPLTGLYIDEENAKRRPVAVTINNYKKALPQSGIGQACIYYETLAEGGITRIIALFQNFDAAKIGPVRSARHYFIDFAYDNDAIYVHHGWSPQAKADIAKLRYPNINGLEYDGTLFLRDPVRSKQPGMYEHSSYISAENIFKAWNAKKYRTELDEEDKPLFSFHLGDSTPIVGQTAKHIRIPFSGEQISEFTYDSQSKLYKRSQHSSPQIDELTGEQLTVKNVLIQFTDIYVIKNDPEGRREVKTVGSGNGMLMTNGMSIPVKWSRANRNSRTIWKDEQGNELKINKGKTWICLCPIGNKVEIE